MGSWCQNTAAAPVHSSSCPPCPHNLGMTPSCLLPIPGMPIPEEGVLSAPHPAFVPPGSLVSWPRSREALGRMCATSSQSLTRISLQAPLSPSSPKFYWARGNEGRPQAPSPRRHCAPLSTTQPSLPLAWTQETQEPASPLGMGSGHSGLGRCSPSPPPAC